MGMQVSVAGNGQLAVEMARLSFFDAILMDVQMPVMDGLQATMAIRSLPGWESIPTYSPKQAFENWIGFMNNYQVFTKCENT